MKRSGQLQIVTCFTRSSHKRRTFATKYGCAAASSYEAILKDAGIEAIINTTPNGAHLETTCMAAQAGKHVFLEKPIANTVHDGQEIARICRKAIRERQNAPGSKCARDAHGRPSAAGSIT